MMLPDVTVFGMVAVGLFVVALIAFMLTIRSALKHAYYKGKLDMLDQIGREQWGDEWDEMKEREKP